MYMAAVLLLRRQQCFQVSVGTTPAGAPVDLARTKAQDVQRHSEDLLIHCIAYTAAGPRLRALSR